MFAGSPGHILVATDLSEQALRAVRRAIRLASQHGARITAAHVLPEDVASNLAEFARARLRRPLIEEQAAGLPAKPTRVVLDSGRPEARIPELAAHLGSDLVVVGTGRHSKLGYALLGGVTHHVLRRARTVVLVVPGVRE